MLEGSVEVFNLKPAVLSFKQNLWLTESLDVQGLSINVVEFGLNEVSENSWHDVEVVLIHPHFIRLDELHDVLEHSLDVRVLLRNGLHHPVIHEGIYFT